MAARGGSVLSSNPLLETFGNAQTLKAITPLVSESSFTSLTQAPDLLSGSHFDRTTYWKDENYSPDRGERNYHIFYPSLLERGPDLQKQLGLDGETESFFVLGQSTCC
jgi:hypothetical protein